MRLKLHRCHKLHNVSTITSKYKITLSCYLLTFLLILNSEAEMVKHLTAVDSEQKKTISDLEADILACHSKEAELLTFSEKMTAKNAQLQSEASGTLSKVLS